MSLFSRPLVSIATALALSAAALVGSATASNVSFSLADSITACPAGDSLLAGRPSRLRVVVTYNDAALAPRVGVPPESVWVEWAPSGAVRVNDQPGRALADDSTDAQGRTRITLPSLSGCGTLVLTLKVSGTAVGSVSANVRTLDSNLDGRVSADVACDLDYDGSITGADAAAASSHAGHSHRNALFGTLVRRTSLCEGCQVYDVGSIGESTLSWSPDGSRIAFTIHTEPEGDCAVFTVPSEPTGWDVPAKLTHPPLLVHDYDPCWSPLGIEIVFGRQDNAIYAKGIPGLNPDTTLRLVTRHNDGTSLERGDLTPAISPDGIWVAFTRKASALAHYELWKTPINGDTTRRVRLTVESSGDDFYPQWSSDGEWIVFDRVSAGKHSVWKVPASGGTMTPVLLAGGGLMASTPAFSPDGVVLVTGVGPAIGATAHTLDATLSGITLPSSKAVGAYPAHALAAGDPVLSPRVSPDGTRLALRTDQLYAARRNMSLPPVIATVAGIPIIDATPYVDMTTGAGVPLSFTIEASDPEGDPLEYHAYFLHDGMSFDPGTRTFSWTPPNPTLGSTSNVRFQVITPSGGTDYAIARITVGGAAGVTDPPRPTRFALGPGRPNPFRDRTALRLDLPSRARVRAEVFDLAGRRVRTIAEAEYPAGSHAFEWDGRNESGRPVGAGLYLCRVSAGSWRAERKLLRIP